MAGIADRVEALIISTVENEGVELWDVRYVKEGSSHYLRVYIDKPCGITIDDCTNVSHAIDPLLDEADIIKDSYYLEVCSPGLERELLKPEHFEKTVGERIKLRLFKERDGAKEFEGVLRAFDGGVILEVDEKEMRFEKNEIAKAKLCDFI